MKTPPALLRPLALQPQGLGPSPVFGQGAAGALRAIEHLGYVQIDTLAVIERAHHHVLWSRVPGYAPEHLNTLLRDGSVFEHWFHAASCLPMRDYRFSLPLMASVREGHTWHAGRTDAAVMRQLLDRVRVDGPLTLRSLGQPSGVNGGQGGWWNAGPLKHALDRLFMQGDLMVRERYGMEKVYDLAERVLPSGLDLREPTLDECARHWLDTVVRAHGVVTWTQLLHLRTGPAIRDAMRRAVDERLADRSLVRLEEAVLPDAYADAAALAALDSAAPTSHRAVRLLSPFDNAVIHRERLLGLFGLDYRLECYTAAPKRVYGYFCLPILFGDRFVGRVDCKAHRRERRFEVLSLHVEAARSDLDLDGFRPALAEALTALAGFCGCDRVDLGSAPGAGFLTLTL
ncbi:winged helix-turn-helix domain-containing protein [Sphaerotilus sp.]|uniref:winged helix-turn-helix domain-containing protein n=1 Tax=Sphaerotilus sp. TaxID=2093942 RepID=UPI002ACE82D7|nr:crosslink repair DNA glycosylase YcaQ family protein [Sphaerotilus sp.]MDZ7854616.1 crosslink repair DNA glycosylase YcaQ family protein [Sphaerotilus sp.]